jgi:protease-4
VDLGGTGGELAEKVVAGEKGAKILLLPVEGVISEQEQRRGPLGLGDRESLVARIREQLERAAEDDEVRAVLLRIDSPGGTVTASEILYREVQRFKEETGRPVVAEVMGVAASGAYYVAMASDTVLAHPTSIVGSIGVIFSNLSLAGLLEKLGVEDQTLTTGPFKDAGSPLRRMRPEERAWFQGVLDDLHARFVAVVDEGRPGLDHARVVALADGRIFSAPQAKELGLVDGIADVHGAIAETERRAGLSESRVVVYHRPREWSENVYSRSSVEAAAAPTVLLPGALPAGFLYLWAGGYAAE